MFSLLSQTRSVRLFWPSSWTRTRLRLKAGLRWSAVSHRVCGCPGLVLLVTWTGMTWAWRTPVPAPPAGPGSRALQRPSLASAPWSPALCTPSAWWRRPGTRALHLSTPQQPQVRHNNTCRSSLTWCPETCSRRSEGPFSTAHMWPWKSCVSAWTGCTYTHSNTHCFQFRSLWERLQCLRVWMNLLSHLNLLCWTSEHETWKKGDPTKWKHVC